MRRKNLFLSLISSVLVAVAIVTVTICSVIKPKTNNKDGVPGADNINVNTNQNGEVDLATKYDLENKFNRNGSADYPYIIYSADNFVSMISTYGGQQKVLTIPDMEEIVGEDGEKVTVKKLDENGNYIFMPVLNADGSKVYTDVHFELVNDIDFTNVNYVTLFNQGEAFIGHIIGNGFALKNITISVNESNLESDFSFAKDGNRFARIALFGETNGATFSNLTIDSLKVNVASEVYSHISAAKYEIENSYAELVVAGIAGYATDTKLSNVTLNAEVEGFNYSIEDTDADGNYIATNAMGGVVADSNNLTIEDSTLNIKLNVNAGGEYYVGGVAAYARTAKVTGSEINVEMSATYKRKLTMAGMFVYGRSLDVQDINVNFTLNETADADARAEYVASLTANGKAHASNISTAAGLVSILRANDETQKSTISNVNVTSNIDFDCIYAGAILDMYSTNATNTTLVTLTDIIVDANVDVLALHGFARQIVAATVSYSEENMVEGYCNIKLEGSAEFSDYEYSIDKNTTGSRYGVTIISGTIVVNEESKAYFTHANKNLYIEISAELHANLAKFEALTALMGSFGSYKVA